MTARRLALPLLAVLLLATFPPVTLADELDQPTPDELALEAVKQPLADAISHYFDTGIYVSPQVDLGDYEPEACEEHCSPPPTSKALSVYARQQINGYYCGVASAQAVLNYTWHIFYATVDGQDPGKNWKKRSVIGREMGTDDVGSSNSRMIKNYLAANANNPPGFVGWTRSVNDSGQQMYSRIAADVSNSSMPVIVAVQPHDPGQVRFLPSWPNEISTVGHFIAIRGYSGAWDGTDTGAKVHYVESSGNGGMQAGPYTVGALTMWTVNNRGGNTIVW